MKTELPNINVQPQQLTLVDKEDIATLIADRLFDRLSNELVNSGTGIVTQVCVLGKPIAPCSKCFSIC